MYQAQLFFATLPRKWLVALLLAPTVLFACLLRCAHLLDSDSYYIISPDSYFFHWVAELVQSGQATDVLFEGHTVPSLWHSGIAYPLAWLAKLMGFISGASPEVALTIASKLLPPILAAMSIAVIYLAVSRMYNRRVALFSALTWAMLPVVIQAAGYLDRDGLSALLLMLGAFTFYLCRNWHWRVGKLDLGWVAGGLAVLAFEVLLYLEWVWTGPVLLLAVVTAFFVVELVAGYLRHVNVSLGEEDDPVTLGLTIAKESLRSIGTAFKESNWRPFTLILGMSILAAGMGPGLSFVWQQGLSLIRGGLSSSATTVMEMRGIGPGDLLGYHFFLIPLLIGLYVAVKNHRRSDLFVLSWYASLFFLAIFAGRVFLYTAPATCVIAGLGLTSLCDTQNPDLGTRYLKMGATVVVMVLLVLISVPSAYRLGSGSRMAVDNDWQDALLYVRDETPEEAVIMTWWDYGYWILDVAERRPVVDNGLYGHSAQQDGDVAVAYCTTEVSEAVKMMEEYGADYLVFSEAEIEIMRPITERGLGEASGDGDSVPWQMQDSVYARAISGDLGPGQGLKELYRNDEVVILGLE